MSNNLLKNESYNPQKFINDLIDLLKLKNDAALSRLLKVAPPVISKIRIKRLVVGASFLVRLHEVTNLPISELRKMMGDERKSFFDE
jgi:hypothetical protein